MSQRDLQYRCVFHSGGVYCWVTWWLTLSKYELNSINYWVFNATFWAYKSTANLIEQAGGLDGRRAGFHEKFTLL
jgi:hypothetical protein